MNQTTNRACLFPGQGAYEVDLFLDILSKNSNLHETFKEASQDPQLFANVYSDPQSFYDNQTYSLAILFINQTYWLQYISENSPPIALAGYSIGQWSALIASQALPLEKAIRLVQTRAKLMDQELKQTDSGMTAIIGLPLKKVLETIDEAKVNTNTHLQISNYNCFGQYTVSGETPALSEFESLIERQSPKKILRLNVSGAWHSDLLRKASSQFSEHLDTALFQEASIPVFENTNCEVIDCQSAQGLSLLSHHISKPVQWESSIKKMIDSGAEEFIEMGPSKMLCKFGFFINRKKTFRNYC